MKAVETIDFLLKLFIFVTMRFSVTFVAILYHRFTLIFFNPFFLYTYIIRNRYTLLVGGSNIKSEENSSTAYHLRKGAR